MIIKFFFKLKRQLNFSPILFVYATISKKLIIKKEKQIFNKYRNHNDKWFASFRRNKNANW
ncbi:MAG: hypothetical protein BAJATHORv1_80003 [Candidatus Thorarchaeota archaeon]|nr:MAG: hypothetical protein BAJATHORv1_80003 [Candidatus Thorarchaeota archaeon]